MLLRKRVHQRDLCKRCGDKLFGMQPCLECKQPFQVSAARRKFCSKRCFDAWRQDYKRIYMSEWSRQRRAEQRHRRILMDGYLHPRKERA